MSEKSADIQKIHHRLHQALPDKALRFMEIFGMDYPVIQAGMDGAATPPLVSAVSEAGGLGTLPLTWRTPDEAAKQVREVQKRTDNPFLANYVLNFLPASLDKALEAGLKWVQFSWGLPDAYTLEKLKRHGVGMGIQVTSRENALESLKLEPDFLICQGVEAGGHVQADRPLSVVLDEVLAVAGDVHVAAAGGIADGAAAKKYLDAGASAVVLGTRFVATAESAAHQRYKDKLVETRSAEDTVVTVCLNKVWPNATHRILRSNRTLQMWEAAGRPPGPVAIPEGPIVGNRPGEYDVVATLQDGSVLERYVDNVPVESMTGCDVDALGTFAGEGVSEINGILSAEEVILQIAEEIVNA